MDGMVEDGTPRIRTRQDYIENDYPFTVIIGVLRFSICTLGFNAFCRKDRRVVHVNSASTTKCHSALTRYVSCARTRRDVHIFDAFKRYEGRLTRCLRQIATVRIVTVSRHGQFLCRVDSRRSDVIDSPEFYALHEADGALQRVIWDLRCRFTEGVAFVFEGGLFAGVLFGVFASGGSRFSGTNISDIVGEVVRGDFTIEARAVRLLRSSMATTRADHRWGWD